MIIFTMVVATSCEKENDPIDEPIVNPIITHAELQGQWNFVSFQHSDGNFYEYPYDCGTYGWYGQGDMEDWIIYEETIDIYDKCEETLFDNLYYTLDLKLNEIHYLLDGTIRHKFKIIEYNSNMKTIKIQKYWSLSGVGQFDGIMTLQKQ